MHLSFRPLFFLLILVWGIAKTEYAWARDPSPRLTPAASPSSPQPTDEREEAPPPLPEVAWKPQYRRYSVVDLGITSAFTAALVTARIAPPVGDGPRGGVWVDEDVRDALRAPGYRGRLLAEDISDVLLGLSVSYALLGDPMVNASWLRKSPDVGLQVGLINAEVLAVTLGTQQLTATLIGRERPYGRICGTDELDEQTQHCQGRDRYRSHFSGHTSVPFSMAAATCTHHLFLPLVGNKAWLSCSLGFFAAASSGALRIVSDNHYLTDVLVGAAVGSLVGFSIPLIHYTTRREPSAPSLAPQVSVFPTLGGLTVEGRF